MELSAVLQAQQAEVEPVTNGDTVVTEAEIPTVTVTNGDGSHISPYTESALPIPPMSQETSQLSSLPTDIADPSVSEPGPTLATDEATALDAAASGLTSKPASVWQAHNLDIDIVSLKLSKHKYLTPSDFLADIAKIEENADKLGDPDRITRIGEMGAHARMHVMGFDSAWEPRFEAYAQRVKERKAKRQQEKEDKKRAEAVPSEDATVLPNGDGNPENASLKRPLEDAEERGREDKRMREGEDIDMADSSLPATVSETVTTIAPKEQPDQHPTITVPPPQTVYPSFILPSEPLANLQDSLVNATAAFTVEQLEQLRATCFDKIWRHRADWDRTNCVKEVQLAVESLAVEVDELGRYDEDSQ